MLTQNDYKVIDEVAQRATVAWNTNRKKASDIRLATPEVLVGIYRPESFPKSYPTEIFITSIDSEPLLFFCTPTQTYAIHPSRAIKSITPSNTPFYIFEQGDQDLVMYGPRSPLRALMCDPKGTSGFSDPRITFALKYIAQSSLNKIPGVVGQPRA